MKPANPLHAANQARWEAISGSWQQGIDKSGVWRRCPQEPGLVLHANELKCLTNISGKRVCVLGSGDNLVAFALAGLGAVVTSVDISGNQLKVANQRAQELDLKITFVQADVTDLPMFADGCFDVVYTGGHIAVWVIDLGKFYREAGRILVRDGLFMVSEYHPFRRIWKESKDFLVIESPYFKRGPFEYDNPDDNLGQKPSSLKSYEFHWTLGDYINSVIASGCRILLIDEFGEQVCDWEAAPFAGLPEVLLIVARKEAGIPPS